MAIRLGSGVTAHVRYASGVRLDQYNAEIVRRFLAGRPTEPTPGTVLKVADDVLLLHDKPVLWLQPNGGLWARAAMPGDTLHHQIMLEMAEALTVEVLSDDGEAVRCAAATDVAAYRRVILDIANT